MELGNMIFGHSRGQFPVEERSLYRSLIEPLFEALGCDSYGIEFSNDVFEMHPYCWCEKTGCPQCDTGTQKNLKHKASGFELAWYKYAMRDAYTDRVITPPQFIEIIRECVESVKPEDKLDPTVKQIRQDLLKSQREALLTLKHNSIYGAHVSYQFPVYTKDVKKGGDDGSTKGR